MERLLATESEAEARTLFRLCSQDQWRYDRAKRELADDSWREKIVPILYRPFDIRWTIYDRNVAVHRRERASDMFVSGKANFGLAMMRQVAADQSYSHVFIVKSVADNRAIFSSRGVMAMSPLWLFGGDHPTDLLDTASRDKRPNLAPDFLAALAEGVGQTPVPEGVLAYIYAVLYAPSYRTRYGDFLKRDFPRIPLPPNRELFDSLVISGRELIALHTMETTLPRITSFEVAGSNKVDKVRWAAPSPQVSPASVSEGDIRGRIYINAEQYFGDVPQAVWDMHIGGYRVAEKWLKDRKGRPLSYDDLSHYQAVVAALARTAQLQADIDAVIDRAGGWPLQ